MDCLTKEKWIIIILLIAWHSVSATNNILAKIVLNKFNHPLTVTLVQFFLTTIFTWPLLYFKLVKTSENSIGISGRYWVTWLIPLAVAKIITTTSSQWSIAKLSVSYVHTVKASMPIFTVVFLRLLFKKKQTILTYFSLLPIIIGVGISSGTEQSFNIIGFISALIATCGFTLQHIFNKRLLDASQIHTFQLVLITGQLSLLLFAPIWVVTDLRALWNEYSDAGKFASVPSIYWMEVTGLLLADGILCFLQNLLAFVILSKVAPLTYSVANATKRIEIIIVSIIILQNVVTLFNVLGMTLAVSGVLLYTYAKQRKSSEAKLDIPESEELNYTTRIIIKDAAPLQNNNYSTNDQHIEKNQGNGDLLQPGIVLLKYCSEQDGNS
ncbi:unnamed protein product [Allacma fusca]|uniref:Sugar phosphate transporter domain-containing protein n=1 Tax=Allacma fusca TaxID=39272 RepID=A0A8J2JS66_9HEXA|nr:unnamed protein product [Allacma fusca]